MVMLKMDCGCYCNGYGFAIGRKFLTVEKIATGRKEKIELNEKIVSDLKDIKTAFDYNDTARTFWVLKLFASLE